MCSINVFMAAIFGDNSSCVDTVGKDNECGSYRGDFRAFPEKREQKRCKKLESALSWILPLTNEKHGSKHLFPPSEVVRKPCLATPRRFDHNILPIQLLFNLHIHSIRVRVSLLKKPWHSQTGKTQFPRFHDASRRVCSFVNIIHLFLPLFLISASKN